jgi:16S rRNA (adenine1518-N6/adenine1519-N6)-dimethyltransferase
VHTPPKRFCQNFLQDGAVIERIVAAIRPQPGERIVEIGPGLGALTGPLVKLAGRITVIEVDRDIVRELRLRHGPDALDIREGDALAMPFDSFGTRLRVVGNLPYNISTPLLFHLDGFAAAIRDCHFMLQREVVRRMAAAPGTPDYGRLSVMLQYRWSIEPLFDVPPTAFHPQPKVWSSIVRMSPHERPPFAASDERRFAEVVTKAFGMRRKTLRNALHALIGGDELSALGIDPSARGETLGVGAFVRIADFLAARGR